VEEKIATRTKMKVINNTSKSQETKHSVEDKTLSKGPSPPLNL
jgi:hypothetical protein